MDEKEKLVKKYSSARSNLLSMILLTGVNLILIAVNASISFPFSAAIPQIAYVFGSAFTQESGYSVFYVIGLAIALFSTAIFVPFYILSKKKYGWLIGALVLFIMDTLLLILFMIYSGDMASYIVDIIFHAWVLYYLITGVSSGRRLSHMTMLNDTIPDMNPNIQQ